jgi:hypothetical protein
MSIELEGNARRTVANGFVVVATALLTTGSLDAQELRIPSGNNEAEIIANAEAEAASLPRRPSPAAPGRNFSASQNGTAERRCVEGSEMGPIRSGEFVIGGMLGGTSALHAGRAGKVWWAPLHHARDMPPLVVRAHRLSMPGDTVRFVMSNVASPVTPGAPPVPEAERQYFFPSGINVPQSGRWLLVATSGQNWGCFILTVR